MHRLGIAVGRLRGQLAQARGVTALGVLGVGLGAACLAWAAFRGVEIPPEGDLLETATFNGALGVFIVTMAALVPGVRWSARGRRVWAGSLGLFTLYSYGIETIQAFRGIDPRFSRVSGPLDQLAGLLFLLFALGVMTCFTVLAAKYFRAPATPLNVAVRYAAVACWIAFGVGIWMSLATRGRFVPDAGNLLFVHAVGFHGLQVVPLLALMAGWSSATDAVVRKRVHLGGAVWATACLALAWQSGTGRAIVDPAPASGVATACLVVFGFLAASTAAAWVRAPEGAMEQ